MCAAITRVTGRYNEDRESKCILEPVVIDLSRYASLYTGPIKYLRLLYIAQICPTLCGQALKLAHEYIKISTHNILAYEQIFEILLYHYHEAHGNKEIVDLKEGSDLENLSSVNARIVRSGNNEAGLVYDEEWVHNVTLRATRSRDHLETDLKNVKANGIKTCIRRAHIEMADFWLKCGDFANALKYYTRSREYSQTWGDELNSCLGIAKVAIYQANWTQASAYAKLAENCCEVNGLNIKDGTEEENDGKMESSKLKENSSGSITSGRGVLRSTEVAEESHRIPPAHLAARSDVAQVSGLVKLATGDYQDAIGHFLQAGCDPDECTPENPTSLLTPTDVARCVTVCALATLDRAALRTRILNHPTFRLVLESEVESRDILTAFHAADYTNVFKRLEKLKNHLKLDLFLADHVDKLYQMIRVKALHQYFFPFATADLKIMATVFGTNVQGLEKELEELIRKGGMKARIDSEKQLICRSNVDDRYQTFKDALNMIDQCHRRLQAAIIRANIVRRGYARGLFPSRAW